MRLLGRYPIIRKMQQMELANHSASVPELPGTPALGPGSPYACLMKLLPLHGNRAGAAAQAHPERGTESCTHVFPGWKADASLHSRRHAPLPGWGPLRHPLSLARGQPGRASQRSLRCSAHRQMGLIPSVTT